MKAWAWMLLASSAFLGATAVGAGCFAPPEPEEEDVFSGTESHLEVVDPLEGAYAKQGGTPVFFVFKKGDSSKSSFFGEIDADGGAARAEGKVVVGKDNLGTTMTLTMSGSKSVPKLQADQDAAPSELPPGQPGDDSRSLVQQAFSGTVHYLKIGKNDTLLVRGDTNGKTAQYRRVKSWCSTDDDCAPDVQSTGVDCSSPKCSSKNTCVCN